MEHARHVFRVAVVLVAGIAAVGLGRGFLVPETYGMYGSYRYANVVEQMSIRPPAHLGPAACAECHEQQHKARGAGAHKSVSCEVCHGPAALHVKDDARVAEMPVDRSYALCARCHRKVAGRPEKFPQVVLEAHVEGELSREKCLECHDAHAPSP